MLKLIFHLFNFLLIILYVYPGSILGFFLYKNITKQPQLTGDFLNISSNHIFAFFILSILCCLNLKNYKYCFFYLIFISIILEILHLYIPNRSFQYGDLIGNILGVFFGLFALIFWYFIKKNFYKYKNQ